MPAWMIRVWRAPWLWAALVIGLFCVPLFVGLARQDFDNDESIYSFSVDVMLKSGDWLTPRLIPSETFPFLEKPPLKFWMVGLPIKWGLLPANEFGMRFWDALMGSIALLYVFAIGRRLAGPVCGLVAVFLLFTHGPLILEHGLRTNNMESAVFLAYAGAAFHFLAWRKSGPDARGHVVAMALFFVLGFMTKFVAALFLPLMLAIAAMLKREDQVRLYFQWRAFIIGALVAIALIAPWFVYEYLVYGPRLYNTMFGEHVMKRLTVYLDPAHLQPWHFYFTHLWSVLRATGATWIVAAGAVLVLWRTARYRWLEGALLVLWFVLPMAAISAGTSKLYHYAYPFLPPVALAGGYFVGVVVNGIWRGVQRAGSSMQPVGRTALAAIPTAAVLLLLPVGEYQHVLAQIRRDAHPLQDLRACLAAASESRPGVWVEGLGFTHRYAYYLYKLGAWEQRNVASDFTVAMHLFSPDSYRPVMLGDKRYADFTAHLSQNPEEVLRGAARHTTVAPEVLFEVFRGSTVGIIPLESATLLLPGPYQACASERLKTTARQP